MQTASNHIGFWNNRHVYKVAWQQVSVVRSFSPSHLLALSRPTDDKHGMKIFPFPVVKFYIWSSHELLLNDHWRMAIASKCIKYICCNKNIEALFTTTINYSSMGLSKLMKTVAACLTVFEGSFDKIWIDDNFKTLSIRSKLLFAGL
jgi:hypothetical protein